MSRPPLLLTVFDTQLALAQLNSCSLVELDPDRPPMSNRPSPIPATPAPTWSPPPVGWPKLVLPATVVPFVEYMSQKLPELSSTNSSNLGGAQARGAGSPVRVAG